MKLNGNLVLNSNATGEIQHAYIERMDDTVEGTTAVGLGASHKGRLIFNTTSNAYKYWDGTQFVTVGTGGNVATLQAELDATQDALGSLYNTTTDLFDPTAFAAFGNVTTPTDLTDALTQLDAAISGQDTLGELTDVTDGGVGSAGFVLYKDSDTTWAAAAPGATSGVQPYDADLATLAGLSGANTIIKRNAGDTAWVAVNHTLNEINDVTITTPANNQVLIYSGGNWINQPLSTVAENVVALGQLSDVQDGLAAYVDGTLYGLVGDNVNSEYDVTVVNMDTLTNVTDAGGAGAVLYKDSASTWAAAAPGATSGVQAYNAALADISGLAPAGNDILVFDGANWTNQAPAAARTTLDVYSTTEADSAFVDVAGDTMTGTLIMSNDAHITLPAPTGGFTSANDVVNRAYVDNLVTAGTVWRSPIVDPDLVGVVSSEPVVPQSQTGYIYYVDGLTGSQSWTGAVTVNEGDFVYWDGAAWTVVQNIAAGDRFIIGGEHGTIENSLSGVGFRDGDLIEFVSGDPALFASWTVPHDAGYQAIDFGTPKAAGDATGLANDATVYTLDVSVAGTNYQLGVTGSLVQTYGTLASELSSALAGNYAGASVALEAEGHFHVYSGDLTKVIVSAGTGVGTELLGALSLTVNADVRAGIENGTTILVNDPDSAHYAHTYVYTDEINAWTEISGPGAVGAGVGLAYAGTTLNVNLGAGIAELPSDEVGLHLYSGTGALILTEDGSTSSTATGAALYLLLDGTTLVQSATGLKVGSAAITATELNASVAGAGLVGGAGTALAVNVDGTTIEITTDALNVVDGGITNVKLANPSITAAADSGVPDAVALGETFTFTGGTNISTTVGANSITFDWAANVGDLGDVDMTTTAPTSNDLMTFNGTNWVPVDRASVVGSGTLGGLSNVAAAVDSATDGQVVVKGATDFVAQSIYFLYTSGAAATTHTVTHSLGVQYCNVTVVDSSDEVIIPQSITFDSTSQLTVTFNTAIDCKVIVMGVA